MNREYCAHCELAYPRELLAPCMTDTGYQHVCGICALELTNALYGTAFNACFDPATEQLRQKAIRWREGVNSVD